MSGEPTSISCRRGLGHMEEIAEAVLFFASDHETNDLREGGKSIGRMAWGQYGNRVGVPRVPELMLADAPIGIVEVPVEWIRDDAVYLTMHRFQSLRPHTPPNDVLDIFPREFDAAHAAGGLFQLTMHPHIITPRSRIWILEEVIRHTKAKGDVWFATPAEVATFAKQGSTARGDAA